MSKRGESLSEVQPKREAGAQKEQQPWRLFEKLRRGPAHEYGRAATFFALFGVTQVIEGISFRSAEIVKQAPAKEITRHLTAEEQEALGEVKKDIAPDLITIGPESVDLAYRTGGNPQSIHDREANGELDRQEAYPGEEQSVKTFAEAPWAGRRYEAGGILKDAERSELQRVIADAIDRLMEPYQSLGITRFDGLVEKVLVRIDGKASDEGIPAKDQKAAQERAEAAKPLIEAQLARKGLDKTKIEITTEREVATGGTLAFANAIEAMGYKFRSRPDDATARHKEVKREFIDLLNNGKIKEALRKLPSEYHDTPDVLVALFHEHLAGQRGADVEIVLVLKPVDTLEPRPEPLTKPHPTGPTKRSVVFGLQEFWRPEEGKRVDEMTSPSGKRPSRPGVGLSVPPGLPGGRDLPPDFINPLIRRARAKDLEQQARAYMKGVERPPIVWKNITRAPGHRKSGVGRRLESRGMIRG